MRFYTMPRRDAKPSRIAAWSVHAYTASGAVLALAGVEGAVAGHPRVAFGAMLLATVVDATDGALARRARVKDALPSIDGARIDDLVDYLTFVFLPVVTAIQFHMLPAPLVWPVAPLVLICSLFGFVAPDAKTTDYFFTGFPSYWNVVVLYLYVMDVPPGASAAVLVVLCALVFVRIGYVYPSRTPVLMRTTLTLSGVWGLALAVIIWRLPDRSHTLALVSLLFPVYYIVLSLVLQSRRAA